MDALAHRKKMRRDVALLSGGIFVAIFLVASGVLDRIADGLGNWGPAGSFLAGVGFSSGFLSIPASVVIYNLAQDHVSFWFIALAAAAGAMIGDLILLRFLRHGLAEDLDYFVNQTSGHKRLQHLFRSRLFYWLGSFVAALIIASPIPDEVGLTIFGILHFNPARFMPISFAMNFLGVLAICLVAQVTKVV